MACPAGSASQTGEHLVPPMASGRREQLCFARRQDRPEDGEKRIIIIINTRHIRARMSSPHCLFPPATTEKPWHPLRLTVSAAATPPQTMTSYRTSASRECLASDAHARCSSSRHTRECLFPLLQMQTSSADVLARNGMYWMKNCMNEHVQEYLNTHHATLVPRLYRS